jgi:hypothetical protein
MFYRNAKYTNFFLKKGSPKAQRIAKSLFTTSSGKKCSTRNKGETKYKKSKIFKKKVNIQTLEKRGTYFKILTNLVSAEYR